MLSLIGAVLKYSFICLSIIILSLVIEVKGVSISRHVEHGLRFISGYNPQSITRELVGDIQKHNKLIDQIGDKGIQGIKDKISVDDEKELKKVLEDAK